MFVPVPESTLASLDACTKLEDYLLERVKKNNHNTKRKALLLIKVCPVRHVAHNAGLGTVPSLHRVGPR